MVIDDHDSEDIVIERTYGCGVEFGNLYGDGLGNGYFFGLMLGGGWGCGFSHHPEGQRTECKTWL